MTSWRFWIPVAIFLGLTPFMLFLGLLSAGAGHGEYFLAKLLFPFTMLSTVRFHSIKQSFLVLAIIQYPLFGLLLGVANLKRKLLVFALALVSIHACFALAAVAFVDKYFS
jgi:hypothetical protein